MPHTIWKTQIDKRYDAHVERTAPLLGDLVLALEGHELLRKPVTITGDARFGVDSQDEQEWVDCCCAIIDARAASPA